MVFYYSSTGNSKHVAKRLGEAFQMTVSDICSVKESSIDLDHEILYFVTYNCFWGVSDIVKRFFQEHDFQNPDKIIFIITCGGSLGGGDKEIEKMLRKKGLPEPIIYELVMVTNYSVLHDIPDISEQQEQLLAAEAKLNQLILGKPEEYRSSFFIRLLQPIVHRLYRRYRNTNPFTVSDACISCMKCSTDCPSKAIYMVNGKPQWGKNQCDHCLRCLHACPVHAINYGKNTVKRARYQYPVAPKSR